MMVCGNRLSPPMIDSSLRVSDVHKACAVFYFVELAAVLLILFRVTWI